MLLLTTRLSSALVPDFALTIHFFHLLVTSFYTKTVPTNLLWWSLQATSAGLMVFLGVWAVRYREVHNIVNFGKRKPGTDGQRADPGGGAGAQSYEMVEQRGDDSV